MVRPAENWTSCKMVPHNKWVKLSNGHVLIETLESAMWFALAIGCWSVEFDSSALSTRHQRRSLCNMPKIIDLNTKSVHASIVNRILFFIEHKCSILKGFARMLFATRLERHSYRDACRYARGDSCGYAQRDACGYAHEDIQGHLQKHLH